MWELLLLDKTTNKTFRKEFNSLYLLNQFKNKLKKGKKLIILSESKVF